jgi:phi LC3 family holin
MKINMKVRLKNPVFWVSFIPALCVFLYTVLGLFDIVPPVSKDELVNWLMMIVTALTNLGVLVDPTTSGMSDSELAMTYNKPSK